MGIIHYLRVRKETKILKIYMNLLWEEREWKPFLSNGNQEKFRVIRTKNATNFYSSEWEEVAGSNFIQSKNLLRF